MIQREILAKLQEWKDSEYRKPLILRGARQVGKTTVVNELGRSFDNYLYFNLEDENTRNVFEFNMPLTDKIQNAICYKTAGQTGWKYPSIHR